MKLTLLNRCLLSWCWTELTLLLLCWSQCQSGKLQGCGSHLNGAENVRHKQAKNSHGRRGLNAALVLTVSQRQERELREAEFCCYATCDSGRRSLLFVTLQASNLPGRFWRVLADALYLLKLPVMAKSAQMKPLISSQKIITDSDYLLIII